MFQGLSAGSQRIRRHGPLCTAPRNGGRDMTRDKLIREARNNGASWPALVLVYGVLLGTLFLTANAII